MGRKSECGEHGEAAQIHGGERRAARFSPPQLNREAGAEEERERPVRLALDEPPDERADPVVDAAGFRRVVVEVDDDHPEQREAAEDVEVHNPTGVVDPGTGRRRHVMGGTVTLREGRALVNERIRTDAEYTS